MPNKKRNRILFDVSLVLMLTLPFALVYKWLDNDVWFIINHGRYLVQNGLFNGAFVSIEPFTVHEGLAFSFEKWLSCLIFYLVYRSFGEVGIKAMVYIMALIIEFLFYRISLYVSDNNRPIAALFTLMICSMFFLLFLVSRPQIFSYAILLVEFYILEQYAKSDKNRLYLLPLLSLAYMQLHSTMWLMFFIAFLPYLFELKIVSDRLKLPCRSYERRPLIIWMLISFLAGFINPYGSRSVFYIFGSAGVKDYGAIAELMPPEIGQFLFMNAFIIVAFVIYVIRKERIPLRYIWFFAGTLFMSIYAIRNTAYFLLYAGIICSAMYKDIKIIFKEKQIKAFVCRGFIILCFNVYKLSLEDPVKEMTPPAYEAFLKLEEETGSEYEQCREYKVYTDFNCGAYAEFLGYRAYIDPRAEVFMKEVNGKQDIMCEYIDTEKGYISPKTLQMRYGFDYWLVRSEAKPVAESLENDEKFALLYSDEQYRLYSTNAKSKKGCKESHILS